MGETVCSLSPGIIFPRLPFYVDLWSLNPACTHTDCPGCSGCVAPEIIIDPSLDVNAGRWEGLYAIVEQQMRPLRPSQFGVRTLVEHVWAQGTILGETPEIFDTGKIFSDIADGLVAEIKTQTIVPLPVSEWPIRF